MIPHLTNIVNSFCLQLMNMQADIAAREPGQQFPNMEEVNAQLRLVTGIEKINRQITLLKKQAAEEATNAATQAPVTEAKATPAAVAAPPALPHGTPPPTGEEPVMTRADHEKYKQILHTNIDLNNTEMIAYKGHHVELLWLLYNVLQYTASKEAGEFLPYTTRVRGSKYASQLQEMLGYYRQLAA
jgi:hypothetical protein